MNAFIGMFGGWGTIQCSSSWHLKLVKCKNYSQKPSFQDGSSAEMGNLTVLLWFVPLFFLSLNTEWKDVIFQASNYMLKIHSEDTVSLSSRTYGQIRETYKWTPKMFLKTHCVKIWKKEIKIILNTKHFTCWTEMFWNMKRKPSSWFPWN